MKTNKKIRLVSCVNIFIVFAFVSVGFLNASIQDQMSNTILKFIPTNPNFIPTAANQDKAKLFLKGIFKSNDIKLEQTESIEFVDPGSNFEAISCNLCGKNINNEVWQNAMDKAYKKHFSDLSFFTPCCHKQTTLNDLTYHASAGFAKFIISVSDPNGDIDAARFVELEKLLGTPVRKIWAHY
jgi:hypothetical protein